MVYLLVSGAGPAAANETDDPVDLLFPRNIAQQTYLEPSLFDDIATKYPSDGSGYVVEYELNGQPYPGDAGDSLVGRGPHGFYDTATFKCQTCHSPHAADIGGTDLLRAGSTGCEFCHVGSSIASSKRVYLASDDPYNLGTDNSGHQLGVKSSVPNSTIGEFTLSCGSCHSVHGATNDLWYPTDFFQPSNETTIADSTAAVGYKLLKADPSGLGTPATTFRDIESSPTTDPATVNQFAFSWWCTNCHNDANNDNTATPFAENTPAAQADIRLGRLSWGGSNETTTFTTDATTHPHSTRLAVEHEGVRPDPIEGMYAGPGQCYTCHRGGLGSYETSTTTFSPVPRGLDPYVPLEAALLAKVEHSLDGEHYQYVQNAYLDANEITCSRCHYGTASFAADTARLYGVADWPHTSSGDYKLLGNWSLQPNEFHAGDVELVHIGEDEKTNWQTYLCGRCHILQSKSGDTRVWQRARYPKMHVDMTTFTNLTKDTEGLLGTFFSPGTVGVNNP